MARTKKQVGQGNLLENVATARGMGTRKSYLAGRGMRVHKKEILTQKCYLCMSKSSFDNQLIPRWISKETMVCICFGCHERTAGWIQVDKPKSFKGFGIGDEMVIANAVINAGVLTKGKE